LQIIKSYSILVLLEALNMKNVISKKAQMIKDYANATKSLGHHPTYGEFAAEAGHTRAAVQHHFFTKNALRDEAKKAFPEAFDGIIDEELYNPQSFKELTKTLGKYKRFFITTAIGGAPIDAKALKSVKQYCKMNKAALLVLPANNDLSDIDPALVSDADVNIVFSDVALNKNLHISTIKINPKAVDPVTGLARIGQRDGSFIFASPKQRLKFVPNSNLRLPHCLMTTGAITKPMYQGKKYSQQRTDFIANYDHVMGGLIVEIQDKVHFHFRQVQFEKNGNFIDLGVYYQGDRVSTVAPKALVLGDYHSIDKDPVADAAYKNLMKALNPETLVLHDAFDGKSISHHDQHKKIYRTMLAEQGKLSLEKELQVMTNDLNSLSCLVKQVVMVKSNHDEFLSRYLDDSRYVNEPHNYKMAAILTGLMVQGKDPLKAGVEMLGLKEPSKFKWLRRDEDFMVARIQLGAHGDKGGNGSKGTLMSMENAYGLSVTGHSHTPEILRGAWQVGTTSKLNLDYTKGSPSSWFQTACLVYPNGSRQLISVVDGKWCLKQEVTMQGIKAKRK
jgi:hypothetical protein